MVKRIRIDASTVKVSGIIYPDGSGVPAAIELEATGEVSVRTMVPDVAEAAGADDGLDLPFLIAPVTATQLEAEALKVVWGYIIAALHDDELVRLARQGVLDGEQRLAAERSIVRALRAKSGRFSRPDFAALRVRILNAARNVEELSRAIGAQVDAISGVLDRWVDDTATGAARTASDAMTVLVREMEALDRAASPIKGKAGGAPRKAWRDKLIADLACDLSLDGEVFDRIAEAASSAVDAIQLSDPKTVADTRKNLREIS